MIKIKDSHITIMVQDMDRSINFYQSIGFSLKQRWENHYAMVSAPGITIGIHPSEDTELNSGTLSIGFSMEDFTSVRTELDQIGIKYKMDEGKSGIYLYFNDPDGTVMYIVEPRWSE